MFEGKTILVAPLDWGLGHASRCVPIISQLSGNNRVIIGFTAVNHRLFSAYFPSHEMVELPSYNMRYSAWLPQWLKVLLMLPALRRSVKRENDATADLVRHYGINVLISDNRYGVYHGGVTSVFVSHQLKIVSPWLSSLATAWQEHYLRRFSQVWIPDYEEVNSRLTGRLADAGHLRVPFKYIGPKSALVDCETHGHAAYDFLVLLSGPEPQRTLLEKKLLERFAGKGHRIALVRGTMSPRQVVERIDFVADFCSGAELRSLIIHSRTVVCRSGYSTLMDMHLLGKRNLVLIPTPGQPEQEYLARHWRDRFGARCVRQKDVSSFAF